MVGYLTLEQRTHAAIAFSISISISLANWDEPPFGALWLMPKDCLCSPKAEPSVQCWLLPARRIEQRLRIYLLTNDNTRICIIFTRVRTFILSFSLFLSSTVVFSDSCKLGHELRRFLAFLKAHLLCWSSEGNF